MSTNKKASLAWDNILFIGLSFLIVIIVFPWYLFSYHFKSLNLIIFSAFYFILSGFSISAGYHRYFSHQSFQAHKFLHWFFILVGASVWQGSIITWVSEHKLHHQHSEEDQDPYPIKYGFWWAYIGWLFLRTPPVLMPRLLNQSDLSFQHKYYIYIAFLGSFGLGFLAGLILGTWWEGVLLIGFVRTVYWQNSNFLINSWAHLWGYKNSNTAHGKNHHLLALITIGEGYHNNHHDKPQKFTTSVKNNEIDLTKYFILACQKIGLVGSIKQ